MPHRFSFFFNNISRSRSSNSIKKHSLKICHVRDSIRFTRDTEKQEDRLNIVCWRVQTHIKGCITIQSSCAKWQVGDTENKVRERQKPGAEAEEKHIMEEARPRPWCREGGPGKHTVTQTMASGQQLD